VVIEISANAGQEYILSEVNLGIHAMRLTSLFLQMSDH